MLFPGISRWISRNRYISTLLAVLVLTVTMMSWSTKWGSSRRLQPTLRSLLEAHQGNLQEMQYRQRSTFDHSVCEDFTELFNNSGETDNSSYIRQGDTTITNIAFLKVHKAGSSTMANLFLRFGLRHNMTFALPVEGSHIKSLSEVIPNKSKSYFDILAVHTVFDKQLYDNLVSVNASKVAIIREPLDRMISAAYFFRDNEDHEFLNAIRKEKFIDSLINKPTLFSRNRYSVVQNSMAVDFGFQKARVSHNNKSIQQYLHYLDQQFRIVLVLERLDESLVLMRRMFNWSLSDILYIPLNTFHHEQVNISKEARAKFRKSSYLDYAIYVFFYDKLEVKLCLSGKDLLKEVAHFRTILPRVTEFCGDNNTTQLVIQESDWNEGFSVTRTDCSAMKRPILEFLEVLKNK